MSEYEDYEYNVEAILNCLQQALDRNEGVYSGIPVCCIDNYALGVTYKSFEDSLTDKEKKKLRKWEYVPCPRCFNNNRVRKLKKNGTSHRGQIILAIMETFRNNGVEK